MDGLLTEITYEFLQDLIKLEFIPYDIRINLVKIKNLNTSKNTFITIKDLSQYKEYFNSIINDKFIYCNSGNFPIITNIKIINNNVDFKNSYKLYDIHNTNKVLKSIESNINLKDIYNKESEKYFSILHKKIEEYVSLCSKAISVRLNNYVNPCYVDKNYVLSNYII